MLRRILALLVAVVALGALAGPAAAAQTPSADRGVIVYNNLIRPAANPHAAYAALSAVDQRSVGLATALTKVTSTTSASFVDPAGCGSIQVIVTGNSLVGTIWHWNVYLSVCTNGSQVYYRTYNVWPSNVAPLWFYDTSDGFPHTSLYGWPGTNGYSYYSEVWSQAHFQECFFGYGIGCVDNVYPYADAHINGNLSYSYYGGT